MRRRIYAELAENYGTSAIRMKIAARVAVNQVSVYMRNIAGRPVTTAPTAPTPPLVTLGVALTTAATMRIIVERPPSAILVSPTTHALPVFVSIISAQTAQSSVWVLSVKA